MTQVNRVKIFQTIIALSGSIGSISLGISTLRRASYNKTFINDSDYADACTSALVGGITSVFFPPLAVVFASGLVIDQINRKD